MVYPTGRNLLVSYNSNVLHISPQNWKTLGIESPSEFWVGRICSRAKGNKFIQLRFSAQTGCSRCFCCSGGGNLLCNLTQSDCFAELHLFTNANDGIWNPIMGCIRKVRITIVPPMPEFFLVYCSGLDLVAALLNEKADTSIFLDGTPSWLPALVYII